jgi:hypothetical protein
MIKKIIAIVAAATCGGAIVTFVSGLATETSARASQQTDLRGSSVGHINKPLVAAAPDAVYAYKAAEQNIRGVSRNSTSLCSQSWPYYEQSCLFDRNQIARNVRVVRVINMDRSATLSSRDTVGKSPSRTQ